MKKTLFACEMVRKELEFAMEVSGFDGETIWLERKLHDYPEKLRASLQEKIDAVDGENDYFLFSFGLCGNGILGLRTSHAGIVIPKFDDCIRILLSRGKGKPIPNNPRALYYTDAWMETEDSLLVSENKYFRDYGEKKGLKLVKIMLKDYSDVTFIDTGLYDIEACEKKASGICASCNLSIRKTQGYIRVYEKLLRGEWDEEFIVKKAGQTVTLEDFVDRAPCEITRS